MYKLIDTHTHIYPDKVAEKATKGIGAFYNIEMWGGGTAEGLIKSAASSGVDHFVVHSAATVPAQVESINNFIASQVQKYPQWFTGLGTMHPDYENIADEIDRLISLGLTGIKLHPDFQKFNIDDKNACKIYECIEGRIPVLFHTGDKRYEYSKAYRVKNIMKMFPKLTVVAAHFGGYSEWEESAKWLWDTGVYVDTCSTFFECPIDTVRKLVDIYGEDHIMFGTDYPMWNAPDELNYIEQLNLSDTAKQKIFSRNLNPYKFCSV